MNTLQTTLLENITWSKTSFHTHREIATALQDKNPHTITVPIKPLKWDLRNRDLKQSELFMQWDPWHTQRIEIIQYD